MHQQERQCWESVASLYDEIADYYHLLWEDWSTEISRQGHQLDELISTALGVPAGRLLDVSCGIGTQCLGLAARGYEVAGSDISVSSLRRAKNEATERGLDVEFKHVDMRALLQNFSNPYDAIICCDNALANFLNRRAADRSRATVWLHPQRWRLCAFSPRL